MYIAGDIVAAVGGCLAIRVSPPPKKKFCDNEQMMGEVIIKWIYFYFFRFCQLFERAMLKNQNQPLKIIKKNFADFLVGSKYEKWCKFTRNVAL